MGLRTRRELFRLLSASLLVELLDHHLKPATLRNLFGWRRNDMERPVEQIQKLKYAGAVDADGHILESAKCWEEYCDPKFRANAVRLKEETKTVSSTWRSMACRRA
jgi:hypothetical protein